MIQFLALSLLLSFIEAKGWGGGSSHSYHSTHNARSGGNYHVYQSTYHGGGRDKLNFNGFIYMPAIQDYKNFILENECVLYEEIQWKL